jgi:hypothetical protein
MPPVEPVTKVVLLVVILVASGMVAFPDMTMPDHEPVEGVGQSDVLAMLSKFAAKFPVERSK